MSQRNGKNCIVYILLHAIHCRKEMVKIVKCYLIPKKSYDTLSKNAIFLARSYDLLTVCLMPVILLMYYIVGYFVFFAVFVYMTTNKYQLIQYRYFESFLWATEKTLEPQMLTCTAKGVRKNFGGEAAREKVFSR